MNNSKGEEEGGGKEEKEKNHKNPKGNSRISPQPYKILTKTRITEHGTIKLKSLVSSITKT